MRQILTGLGFEDITITKKENSDDIIKSWNIKEGAERFVFSGTITATKPAKEPGR